MSSNELPVHSLDEARMNRAAWAESNPQHADLPIDPIEELIASPERSTVIALALSAFISGLLLFSAGIGVAAAAAVLLKQSWTAHPFHEQITSDANGSSHAVGKSPSPHL